MTSGLDDVVAAETILSDVDGLRGQLIIRGYSLDQLAGHTRYDEAVSLLFDGFFDELPSEQDMVLALGNARADVFDRLSAQINPLANLPIYDGMRAGIALLPDGDTLEDALRLIAAPAVLLPALLRRANGELPIIPDPLLVQTEDVIRMIGIAENQSSLAAALDTYLVTVCDHGLNASTFAARVVASTQTGLVSSVLAGLGALKGPLHGGAPGPIIAMLDTMAEKSDPHAWLTSQVASGERIMGFGHRIYRVRDPRADALKTAVKQLMLLGSSADRLAFAESAEEMALDVLRTAKPDRVLETNVEFYTAILLEAIGFPPESFTCVFAMGRISGWISHAREQQLKGRLIRPQSIYVGPEPRLVA